MAHLKEIRGSVTYGQKVFKYSCNTTERKTLEIAVYPDASVRVKAPVGTSKKTVEGKLLKRARWVVRQQTYFGGFNPRATPRVYVAGETHLYLGKQYQLKVVVGEDDGVSLKNGAFWVSCSSEPTTLRTKELMDGWYRQKAIEQFTKALERCWPVFNRMGLTRPSLTIKCMKKRWGSLSKSGRLTLNSDLVKAPKECIDYVVIHELCHLKHHNHSKAFYQLLESVLPDWESLKQKLELRMA